MSMLFPRFSKCIKTVGEMVGDRPAKPRKTAHYSRYIDTKIRLLGHDLFPKSLTSSYLPTEALNEA
jgi:hypothetical protein